MPIASTIVLRPVQDDDLPVFFEHQREPEGTRLAAFSPRDRETFQAHWAKIRTNGSNLLWTVVEDGRTAGHLGAWQTSEGHCVGYWLGREFWGRGVASAALAQFLDIVRVRPLFARVAAHNIASLRVLQKCGFAIVGEETGRAPDGTDLREFVLTLGVDVRDVAKTEVTAIPEKL